MDIMKGFNIVKYKYKIGDKVRVRSDLKLGASYSMEDSDKRDTVTKSMFNLRGQIVTINEITEFCKYRIKEDYWNWTDGMFDGLANGKEFHVYDTVKHELYGLGTVVKIGSNIDVDFDEKPFDRPSLKNNVLHCRPENLIIVEAYIGGEDN